LVHIGSAKRLKEMADINGLTPFSVDGRNSSQNYNECYFIAGKAILMNGVTFAEVVGYVVDENAETVSVKIDSNETNENVVVLLRPKYVKEEGKFEYWNMGTDLYKWVEYHPIRMKIRRRGNIYFTINRIHINKDEDVIVKI
jgi:hypothetical protein